MPYPKASGAFMIKIPILIFFLSCSHFNSDSQNHFKNQQARKHHGVISIPEEVNLEIDPLAVSRGHVLYQNNCMECHGAEGKGDGPNAKYLNSVPKNLVTLIRSYPNFKFYLDGSQASGNMPGWFRKYFSNQDLKDLALYLRKLSNN